MTTVFPRQIASRGITIYLISLIVVSLMYSKYAVPWYYAVISLIWVMGFFKFVPRLILETSCYSEYSFVHKVFWFAFVLRITWVLFSYFFYEAQTGIPFEFNAADSQGYHEEAKWLADSPISTSIAYYAGRGGVSDVGYTTYLQIIYRIFGPSIIIARFFKAILSSWTCVLLYKLAERNIGLAPARIAAIIAVFMPNLIVYCGLHLKETEMMCLMVAFLERADYLLRKRRYVLKDLVLPLLLAGSLFFFRTVMGLAALFSLVTALLFMPGRTLGHKSKRFVLIGWVTLAIGVMAGGIIYNDIEEIWSRKDNDQVAKRVEQSRGNSFAAIATGAVLAPMEFVIPFATMVEIEGQQQQLILSGGNYVRNFMGIFVMIALFLAIFVNKDWRNMVLIGSFTIIYLLIVAMSSFASAERFLLPGLPGLIIFWAYGLSHLTRRSLKYVNLWGIAVVIMEVGWAFIKLEGRGII